MQTDAQVGVRKGRSTIAHIFTLHTAVEKQLANKSKLYVAFIVFKKAYHTVNRNILWSVLLESGIQGRMLRTLKAMYISLHACFMSDSEVTGFFVCLFVFCCLGFFFSVLRALNKDALQVQYFFLRS